MRRRRWSGGFTLLEVMVVVAIVLVIAAMAWGGFGRQRPRQKLNGFALELRALLFSARQNALATGKRTVVMVFPDQATSSGVGRLVLYEDGDYSFFSAGSAFSFADDFDPDAPAAGPAGQVLDVVDLPSNVTIGPAAGQGVGATMKAPFAGIAIDTRCSFCDAGGTRCAVAFDGDGVATFHGGNGPPLDRPSGASLSVTAADSAEVRTIAIAAATGALQSVAGSL